MEIMQKIVTSNSLFNLVKFWFKPLSAIFQWFFWVFIWISQLFSNF